LKRQMVARARAVPVIVGLALILLGVIGQTTGLTSITTGCATFNLVNPSNSPVFGSTPTNWNVNQTQLLSVYFTLNNCKPRATTVPEYMQLACTASCSTLPTYPLATCAGCIIGAVQVVPVVTSGLCSTSTVCSGWMNYTWGSSSTTGSGITGEGSYPPGASFSVVWGIAYTTGVPGGGGTVQAQATAQINPTVSSVKDFSLASYSPPPVPVGQTYSVHLTVNALNGFNSTVNLSMNCSSSGVTTCQIANPPIVGSGGATITLGSSCCPGAYSFTVVAIASTGQLHTLTLPVVITGSSGPLSPDFTVTGPASIISFGQVPANSTIAISSLNGFAGPVTIAVQATSIGALPAGAVCSASPSSLNIISGSLGSFQLFASANAAATFNCQITVSAGTLVHSLTLAAIYAASSSGPSNCLLCPYSVGGIPLGYLLIGVGAVLSFAPLATARRRRTSRVG